MRIQGAAVAIVVALVVGGCSGDDDATPTTTTEAGSASTTAAARPVEGPVPELAGPVTGGRFGVPYNPAPPEILADAGYVEEEYLISGEASAYAVEGELSADGRWGARAAETAEYTSRIIVRRPADDADFTGTVVVEWLNVSAGRDSDPEWGMLHPSLLADGQAYVGVSAQRAGIEGGASVPVPGVPEIALAALKEWDPDRYAPLTHPGDDFSYDLFTQVGRLLRTESEALGGLAAERVVAVGESQSAARLVTYANAVQPLAEVYDALLVASRGGGAAPLSEDATPESGAAPIRDDLAQPVLQVQAETDLTFLGFRDGRQPDTDSVVTWEIAGAAHADAAFIEYGAASGEVWAGDTPVDFAALCGGPLNEGPLPQVTRAAYAALLTWIDGTVPPSAPALELAGEVLARDERGIALGGIRTPPVEAPTTVLSGDPRPDASVFCSLFGSTEPLPDGALADLYADADAYLAAVETSADAAVADGFLLTDDRDAFIAEAEARAAELFT